MHTSLYRAVRNRVGATPAIIGEQVLSPETREREEKIRTELELWGQQVKKEAQLEASRGAGAITLGGIETQLRRISEQVTREAQDRLFCLLPTSFKVINGKLDDRPNEILRDSQG